MGRIRRGVGKNRIICRADQGADLWPKHDVPAFQPRAGTQYWDLPTGSRIGYTHLPAPGGATGWPIIRQSSITATAAAIAETVCRRIPTHRSTKRSSRRRFIVAARLEATTKAS